MKRTCFVFTFLMVVVTRFLGQDVGNATYYHPKFHGRHTSDGSTYHKDSMTCAHKTYPLGTLLHVKNPRNGKQVIVKVTDRGPFSRRLAIDLSHRAAQTLGILRHGIAPVQITPYKRLPAPYNPPPLTLPPIRQPQTPQTTRPLSGSAAK